MKENIYPSVHIKFLKSVNKYDLIHVSTLMITTFKIFHFVIRQK